MSVNRRRGIIIGIILVLLMIFFYRRVKAPALPVSTPITSPSSVESVDNSQITKCQNVVVSPGTTVELFTYESDSETRFDYRVAAMSEEEAVNLQVLSTGGYLYAWNVPHRYTSDPVPNPPGKKLKQREVPLSITTTPLDQVIRFGASGFSGDKMCSIWDDVDPVFEVPESFEFVEGDDTIQKLEEDLAKICQICAKTKDDQLAATCRQNLSCK